MRQPTQQALINRALLMGMCVMLMSGCAWNDAGQILYQSVISKQKFDCENDKVGDSIERCKQDIDASIDAAQAVKSDPKEAVANEGYEPKDFVKKQINRVTRSTQ
ncbi:MAG: hypothetical protein ABF267_02065 [Glaciecola sp.]|jgi:hypothetical protein